MATETRWYLRQTLVEPWSYLNGAFNDEEIAKIIKLSTSKKTSSGLEIGKVNNDQIDNDLRQCQLSWVDSSVESNSWLFQKFTKIITDINFQFFKYELSMIDSLQFTKYSDQNNSFYGKHVDIMHRGFSVRKLSVTLQLSDPSEYEGGDLLLHYKKIPAIAPKGKGSMTFFPSTMLHEVTPVTKGTRLSLVGWVSGPPFK